MSEPAAPHPDPDTARPLSSPDGAIPPMPYPGATSARPLSSPDGAVPPMPSEATNGRTHKSTTSGRWRLRKMMRRTPPGAA
jgi:hypothetical protein